MKTARRVLSKFGDKKMSAIKRLKKELIKGYDDPAVSAAPLDGDVHFFCPLLKFDCSRV